MTLTNNEFKNLDDMIRGIAYAKRNHVKLDVEDVIQSLWLNTLEIIQKKNEIDYNYIAAACFKHIKYLAAKSIRNQFDSYDMSVLGQSMYSEERNQKGNETESSITFEYCSCSKPEKVGEKIEFEEMINCIISEFGSDSKQVKFVQAWLGILGIDEELCKDILDEVESKTKSNAYEGYIAKEILGYSGSYSSGYQRIKRTVRSLLEEFGYADKYAENCVKKSNHNSQMRKSQNM